MITGLPRDCFTCDSIFQDEMQRIMAKNWLSVAALPDFAGDDRTERFLTVQVGNYSIILVRHSDGQVSACHNVCRHRGTRLLTDESGELKNGCITCPYHAWTYDRDGQLIGAPNMAEVKDFDKSQFGLLPVACHTWAGMVFLNLDDSGADFGSDMQPLMSRMNNWQVDSLRLAKTIHYDVNANWKLLFQNYSECYHCPTVHPDLNQQTPYRTATNDFLEGPILGGPMQLADGFETVSKDGKAIAAPFPALDAFQRNSVFYYTVFPNMFVSAHPDYVMFHRLIPVDCRQTQVICHFMVDDQTSDAAIEPAWKMWDSVNKQDWQVCELTQLGANSPVFQPGPYSGLESMLAAFDRHYRNAMATS